ASCLVLRSTERISDGIHMLLGGELRDRGIWAQVAVEALEHVLVVGDRRALELALSHPAGKPRIARPPQRHPRRRPLRAILLLLAAAAAARRGSAAARPGRPGG